MKKIALLLTLLLSFAAFAQNDLSVDELEAEQDVIAQQLADIDPVEPTFDELLQEYLALDSKRAKRKYRRSIEDRKTRRMLKRSERKWPGPRLVCVYGHAGAVISGQGMRCTNFRGEKYLVGAIGIGYTFNLSGGVLIMKTKDNDPSGEYTFGTIGGSLGLGFIAGEHFKTSNPDAKARIKILGLGLGLGIIGDISKLFIEKIE